MSRTRLAAAAGVAALTLGATAAVADDPDADQTVTITVNAAPRTLTGPGNVTLTTTVGTNIGVSPLVDDGNSITYTNPGSQTAARIDVTSDGTDLPVDDAAGQLTLTVVAADPGSDAEAEAAVSIAANTDTGGLITGIPAGTTGENVGLTFTLSSANETALADARNITRTVTYTITDNE